jgi:hypothetical protein
MEIRNTHLSLQEGSLELMENLPVGVLGYTRSLGGERMMILLNFDVKLKEFQTEATKVIFKLSKDCQLNGNRIHLSGYGGLILRYAS